MSNLINTCIIYVVSYDTEKNIYKVGSTVKQNFIDSYPPNTKIIYMNEIKNRGSPNIHILNKLKNKFTPRYDIGRGYFEGNSNDIIKTINYVINYLTSERINVPMVTTKYKDYNNCNSTLLAIKSIEKYSKDDNKNISKYLECFSKDRIDYNYITIGHCLKNIDDNLFDLWKNLNNNSFNVLMTSSLYYWNKIPVNSYNIATIKLWALLDNSEKCFKIIHDNIIINIIKYKNIITPYNMALITYPHFKHFHIYTNNKWYYYDIINYRWELDVDNLNIRQSLIGNIILIIENKPEYNNILELYYNDEFIDELLKVGSNIFFNKNLFSKEYLCNTMIDYHNLP
jgi:hypothetical protein